MNTVRWITLSALIVALAAPFTRPVIGGEFVDTLASPAIQSEKALQGLFTGLASAGDRLVAVGQRGHIFYSDDAGIHWRQAQVPVSSDLVAVQFPNPSQGWVVGHDGIVLHSNDSGETWTRQFDGRELGSVVLQHYQQQAAQNPNDEANALLLGEAQRLVEEGADKPFLDLWFANEQTGYIVGAFNLIFRTDDGGRTWLPLMEDTDNPGALNLYGIRAIGSDLFIVGEQGLVLKLDPVTQRFISMPTPYSGSYFGVTGKPGSVLVYGLRGNVYRSVDHGASWSKVEIDGVSSSITAGTVTADGRIILVSQAGHVLVSVDNGASFTQPTQQRLASAAAVQATVSGAVVVAGAQGLRQLSAK